MHFNNNPSVLQ